MIGEPSLNEVVIAEKGALWIELTTYGGTNSTWVDAVRGRNAFNMMLALLNEIDSSVVADEPHPLLGEFTRSIKTISAGVGTNVVPDRCVAAIDMRTVLGQDHNTVTAQITNLIGKLKARDADFQATLKVTADYPPLATPPDSPVVVDFLNAVESVTGVRGELKPVHFYSDAAAYIPALGVPLIICGPGRSEMAHQPDEHVDVPRLVEAVRIYLQFAVTS